MFCHSCGKEILESSQYCSFCGKTQKFSTPQNNRQNISVSLMDEMEKELIAKTLNDTKWHKGEACRILGFTRPRLDRKIEKYGLHQYLQDD